MNLSSGDSDSVSADACAPCDRFTTELLQLGADAYPGGDAHADSSLCERLGNEFKEGCASYVAANGGLGDVDVMIAQNPSQVCAHLKQCHAAGSDDESFLSTGSEDSDEDADEDKDSDSEEDDDEDEDDEDKENNDDEDKENDEDGENSAFLADDSEDEDRDDDDESNVPGTRESMLASMTDNLKRSQAIQMMNSRQMSEMELMNNALRLHDMTMYPSLHELPCINPDDAECQTAGLLHGMNYLMMSNTMPNGGLDNAGLSLAMMATAYPNNPHQNA